MTVVTALESPRSETPERRISETMKTERVGREEKERAALLAWTNTFLKQKGLEALDLSRDFRDGVMLIRMLEEAFGEKVCENYNLRPKMEVHKLDNLTLLFDYLQSKNVFLLSIGKQEIVRGDCRHIVRLLSSILRSLTIRNLSSHEGHTEDKPSSSVRAMVLDWVNNGVQGRVEHQVSDLWSSLRDGQVLTALISELIPEDVTVEHQSDPREALKQAFALAEEYLGIPSLVSVDELLTGTEIDEKIMESYLCMLISVQKSQQKKETQMKSIKARYSMDARQKEAEVESLRQKMEQEQEEVQRLQDDVIKMQNLFQDASAKERELQSEIEAVEVERQNFMSQIETLKEALGKSQESLQSSRKQEMKLQETLMTLSTVLETKEQRIDQLASDNTVLKTDLYKAHLECEDVIQSFRSQMAGQTAASHQRVSIIEASQYDEMQEQASLLQKGINDFLHSMVDQKHWLMKSKVTKRSVGKEKKRWIELRGDTLYWYKSNQDRKEKGSINLKYVQKIPIELTRPFDALTVEQRRHALRSAITNEVEEDTFIDIIPRDMKNNPLKKTIRIAPVHSLASQYAVDIIAFAEEINARIALIEYITAMFEEAESTGHIGGCKEVLSFVCDPEAKHLKIEHVLPDDFENALRHFKDVLRTRQDLSITICNAGATDAIVQILADVLCLNNTVDSVILRQNRITSAGAAALGKALEQNYSLRELDLAYNAIQDEGVDQLVKGLTRHPCLSKLDLSGCHLSDAGGCSLLQGITESLATSQSMYRFPVIALEDNAVGDETCAAIATLCRAHHGIKALQLNSNCVTDIGITSLSDAIQAGCGIEELHLAGNQVSSKGAEILSQSIDETTKPILIDLSHSNLIGRKGFTALFNTQKTIDVDLFTIRINCVPQQ